ncbi:dodecin domain-containing protein [archaeon]|nr:dodecin domain-containing protein [archaeon]
MTVAKIIEIVGCSSKSFNDAIKNGVKTAQKTIRNIRGAHILGKNVKIRDDKIIEYRVNMKLSFGVEEKED